MIAHSEDSSPGRSSGVVVVGQAARDLVLRTEHLPEPNGDAAVAETIETLGGKGANQSVGLRQLGASVRLLAVLGTDAAGDDAARTATSDGIDLDWLVRRGTTALLVDVVDADASRFLLERVPDDSLVVEDDVRAAVAAGVLDGCDTVVLQLQQPPTTVLEAARAARERGLRVVIDGGLEGGARDEALGLADVVRADATEARMLTGTSLSSPDEARAAAASILSAGVSVVALTVEGEGDLVAWPDGDAFFAFGDAHVVDPTGAGDAFVAGLVTGLRLELHPGAAGELAHRAAAATVGRVGGRPDLRHIAPGA
ncbi:ribokinase [Labedella populi]|uniref:Ribokinase n=1 Tax=Labedella populi TaxID=2498850 RepID=A0A3S4C8K1_9MICO|nr:PfkB family carbohydrate kinase [Labedella populi]RWZ64528.1 ribokinase [Labedella populi]